MKSVLELVNQPNVMDVGSLRPAGSGRAQEDQGLSYQSFLIALGVYGGISIFVVSFEYFRGRKLQKWHKSRKDENPFLTTKQNWWGLDEHGLISERGIDGYLLVRFFRAVVMILLPLTVVVTAVLIPIDITAGTSNSVTGLDRLSWVNLQTGQMSRFSAHLVAALIVDIHVCVVLVSEFRALIRIRHKYLLSSASECSNVVLVTDVPRESLLNGQIWAHYARFNGRHLQVWINRDMSRIEKDIQNRDQLICKLEALLTRHIRYWERGPHEEICSIARKIESVNTRITKAQSNPTKYPEIPSAFLVFSDPVTAHTVQQLVADAAPLSMIPHPIAGYGDVIWSSLHFGWRQRFCKKLANEGWIVFFTILWTLPTSVLGMLSQISYLSDKLAWVRRLFITALGTSRLGLIQGIVPQLIVSLFMMAFPYVLERLAYRQGHLTHSSIELTLQRYYFLFLYVQLFLVVSISSSITTILEQVLSDPKSMPLLLAQNIPKCSNYFYSYLVLQIGYQCAFSLHQLPGRIWYWLLAPWSSPRSNWTRTSQISQIRWGLIYPIFANLACICIIFSVVAPLILPVGTTVFATFWFAYGNRYICDMRASVDTGGLIYWGAMHQLFVGVYFSQLCLVGLFLLRGLHILAFILVLLVCLTVTAHYVVFKHYAPRVKYLALNEQYDYTEESACQSFSPPCLSAKTPIVWAQCSEAVAKYLGSKHGIHVSQRGLSHNRSRSLQFSPPPDEM